MLWDNILATEQHFYKSVNKINNTKYLLVLYMFTIDFNIPVTFHRKNIYLQSPVAIELIFTPNTLNLLFPSQPSLNFVTSKLR